MIKPLSVAGHAFSSVSQRHGKLHPRFGEQLGTTALNHFGIVQGRPSPLGHVELAAGGCGAGGRLETGLNCANLSWLKLHRIRGVKLCWQWKVACPTRRHSAGHRLLVVCLHHSLGHACPNDRRLCDAGIKPCATA